MPSYDIEFTTAIYITIPVEADSLDEARDIADRALTRHSIQNVDLSDDLPAGASVRVDVKGWELNAEDENEDDLNHHPFDSSAGIICVTCRETLRSLDGIVWASEESGANCYGEK